MRVVGLVLVLLPVAVVALPQAIYQLFALSPFRLDSPADKELKREIPAAPSTPQFLTPKGGHVLLLLPQKNPLGGLNFPLSIPTSETTLLELDTLPTSTPAPLEQATEPAEVLVDEPTRTTTEEALEEASGEEQPPVVETVDIVVETDASKTPVEETPLTESTSAAPPANDAEAEPTTTQEPEELATLLAEPENATDEVVPMNQAPDSRLSESVDEVVDEIVTLGDEQKVGSSEVDESPVDDIKLRKVEPEGERLAVVKPRHISSTEMLLNKDAVEEADDDEHEPLLTTTESPQADIEIDSETEIELEPEAETESPATVVEAEPATTTSSSQFFKQVWPTEVVIEGKVFYLVPKNARARDFLEPYSGGGYVMKQSPQQWFRGLQNEVRAVPVA